MKNSIKSNKYLSATDYVDTLSASSINKTFRIAGTDFDRRRKVTKLQQKLMKKMVKHDVPTASVARYFGVTPCCVKYNTDAKFRKYTNSQRTRWDNYNNSHFKGEDKARAEYKIGLINLGKMI